MKAFIVIFYDKGDCAIYKWDGLAASSRGAFKLAIHALVAAGNSAADIISVKIERI